MLGNRLTAQRAMQQYGAQQDQQQADATPHQMIAMLFAGAISALNKMLWAMEQREVEIRGQSASKAVAIVNGMRDCLDMSGGELAENLYAVYSFLGKDIVRANYENDETAVTEAIDLLRDIKESWDRMPQAQGQGQNSGAGEAATVAVPAFEPDSGSKPVDNVRKPALGLRQSAFYS